MSCGYFLQQQRAGLRESLATGSAEPSVVPVPLTAAPPNEASEQDQWPVDRVERLPSALLRGHMTVRLGRDGKLRHWVKLAGDQPLYVHVLNAEQHGLTGQESAQHLLSLEPATLDPAEHRFYHWLKSRLELGVAARARDRARMEELTPVLFEAAREADRKGWEDRCRGEFGKLPEEMTPREQAALHQRCVREMMAVDVDFAAVEVLHFVRDKDLDPGCFARKGVQALPVVYNVPDLDNAFYFRGVLWIGAGKTQFNPLGSLDVAAHELFHYWVELLGGLRYQGLSGALNESMADIQGVSFEFYVAEKYRDTDLQVDGDWTVGEDLVRNPGQRPLRSLSHPEQGSHPQPRRVGGPHWADPRDLRRDRGGVHINSGVPNHVFYQACQAAAGPGKPASEGIAVVLPLVAETMRDHLRPDATFWDFRRGLCAVAQRRAPQLVRALRVIFARAGVRPPARPDPRRRRRGWFLSGEDEPAAQRPRRWVDRSSCEWEDGLWTMHRTVGWLPELAGEDPETGEAPPLEHLA